MVQKPKVQYVGQFYVHGSEARKLELEQQKQKARANRPMARLQQIEVIYLDPVAVAAIAVALFMLAVMLIGAVQLRSDWAEYHRVGEYLSELNGRNATLSRELRAGYDLEDIQIKAAALGLVSKSEAQRMTVSVTVPEPEPEVSQIQRVREFLEGLFA